VSITQLVGRIVEHIVNPLMLLIIGAGLLYFLWGLAQFIMNTDNESGRADGKRHMIWGVFGVFIMVSVWGILQVLFNTVNLFK
jgi:uncharacterized membrane protein YidH (DUF202 family)